MSVASGGVDERGPSNLSLQPHANGAYAGSLGEGQRLLHALGFIRRRRRPPFFDSTPKRLFSLVFFKEPYERESEDMRLMEIAVRLVASDDAKDLPPLCRDKVGRFLK